MAQINFMLNPKDFRAVLLGKMGFSNDYIQRQTGLTPCQVTYRLKRAKIRLSDYRNGNNPVSKQVVMFAQEKVADKLRDDLSKIDAIVRKIHKPNRKVA